VRAIEEVTADEDDVGAELAKRGDDAGKKTAALDVAEMRVCDEGGYASAPGGGEAGEFHGDAIDAEGGGVNEAVERGGQSQSEEEDRDAGLAEGKIQGDGEAHDNPGEERSGYGEIDEAEPSAGDAIEDAHGAIEEAMREEGGGDEADGEERERDLESGEPRLAGRAEEGEPGFVEEEMGEEKNGLNDCDGGGDAGVHDFSFEAAGKCGCLLDDELGGVVMGEEKEFTAEDTEGTER
jgi:hypothetical protein